MPTVTPPYRTLYECKFELQYLACCWMMLLFLHQEWIQVCRQPSPDAALCEPTLQLMPSPIDKKEREKKKEVGGYCGWEQGESSCSFLGAVTKPAIEFVIMLQSAFRDHLGRTCHEMSQASAVTSHCNNSHTKERLSKHLLLAQNKEFLNVKERTGGNAYIKIGTPKNSRMSHTHPDSPRLCINLRASKAD